MDTNQRLLLPLLHTPPQHHHHSKTIQALVVLILIGLIAIWAGNESSKSFDVTVLNSSETDSLAAQRFNLMYVSNGKAARILIRANRFVQDNLRIESNAEGNIRHVTLHLSDRSMSSTVNVTESRNEHEFVLTLNPSLLLQERKSNIDADVAVAAALLRGMTRVRMLNFCSESGADTSMADVKIIEESVILKVSKVHLTEFHRLID
ncbi:unnamed protein product [Rhodiola kirilowii]